MFYHLKRISHLRITNHISHYSIIIIGSFSLYGLIISCIIAKHVNKSDRWFIALTIMAYMFSLISLLNLMSYLILHYWEIKSFSDDESRHKYIISFICLVLSTVLAITAVSMKKHVRDYNEIMGDLVNTVWCMLVFQIVCVLCALIFGHRDFLVGDDD